MTIKIDNVATACLIGSGITNVISAKSGNETLRAISVGLAVTVVAIKVLEIASYSVKIEN